MTAFIIYALPRSRTRWLAQFLSYRDWHCGHDEIRHARSLDDVKSWFAQPNTGTTETSGAPWWRTVQRYCPDIKTVVIRRPVAEVVESLARFGMDRGAMWRMATALDHKLDQIEARVPDVLSVPYAALSSGMTCGQIFEHCLPYRHDHEWWQTLNDLNIQIDMGALARYYRAYQPQLDKLTRTAKVQEIAAMRPRETVFDGMEIQQEPFDTFLRDGADLFAEHAFEVGEPPDAWKSKNIELMREYEHHGALQVTTARSNGRMFGYLMAVLSPSLESPDILTAQHTTFFTSRDTRGLGMKLQRSSIAALRQRGVSELYLRAGVRGSAAKVATLFRRLGADDFGQVFKLDMKDAA